MVKRPLINSAAYTSTVQSRKRFPICDTIGDQNWPLLQTLKAHLNKQIRLKRNKICNLSHVPYLRSITTFQSLEDPGHITQ
uniref:Uncharacterized protein n=1 Tax=Picea glauca TaxID=3330 RepID=A0A101LXW1_PICGL|nr:hypothetical protein ABT39_MTgene5571 [Picea glauca]QHR89569.1 hypothetical protein Q903MT_gene3591 [Picea sitchensis]